MNLQELRAEFRERVDDLAQPYLWADESVNRWLNEAEREATERARLLYDESTIVSRITLRAGVPEYKLNPLIIDIDKAGVLASTGRHVLRTPREQVERIPNWQQTAGNPSFFFFTDDTLSVWPVPPADDSLQLRVWRYPREVMERDEDEPEIPARYHMRMVDWACHLAYLKRDADAEDQRRADRHEAAFINSFGIRRDSNVQRKQRRHRAITTKPIF